MWKGTTFHLSGGGQGVPKPAVKGIQTGEEQLRVDRGLLERIYYTDPVVFNAVNTYVHTVTSNLPMIKCKKRSEEIYMARFVKRTKLFNDVIPKLCQNLLIFGCAYNEVAYKEGDLPQYDEKGKKVEDGKKPGDRDILRLFDRDPKSMDFLRSGFNRRIIYDEFQEPKAYVMYLHSGIESQPGEITVQGQRALLIDKERVMYSTLFTLGDSYEGIGLIEPSANSCQSKASAEKGFAKALFRLGHGIVGVEVGSPDTIFPDKAAVDSAAEVFKDINESSTIAYPYYLKPGIIETKRGGDDLKEQVSYFTEQQVAGFGMASAMATGQGSAMNRSILDKLMILFYQKVGMVQDRISQSLEEQVFSRIAEDKGWNSVPRLVWAGTSNDLLSGKADRVSEYVKTGAITATFETECHIREIEGLPEISEKEYKEAQTLKYIHQRAGKGQVARSEVNVDEE